MKKLILLLYFVPALSLADIYKEAQVCPEREKICFVWWPKLPEVDGWYQDMDHSYHYKMNAQAPEGYSFANAEAVIYARAVYQADTLQKPTLSEFISSSQKQFVNNAPSTLDIKKTGELNSKGQHNFVSYSFYPDGQGNWEQVAYTTDADNEGNNYFIIVVLSARSQAAFDQNIHVYNELIENYR